MSETLDRMAARERVRRTKGSAVYPAVARSIQQLGRDISFARRARRISAEEFAASMGVSRATLHRLEHGDPGISINTLAMALHALGRLDLMSSLVDVSKDDVGLMTLRGEVPRRVRRVRRRGKSGAPESPAPVTTDDGFVGW